MKCSECPMLSNWGIENKDKKTCGMFRGYKFHRFQYVDSGNKVAGCFLEKDYILETHRMIVEKDPALAICYDIPE